LTVAQAYAVCRGIARRQAKNFYFAFLALPARKRDAICAVYAFMRHADDISDDESLSKAERRARMAAWVSGWHTAAEQGDSADPVFLALNDARVRFRIPLSLLDQLVEGTAMDLRETDLRETDETEHDTDETEHDTEETFADFPALRRYCYLVASVVGLVCIRIFEYRSPEAEKLAEELGIAFQLTNILRDVREDAERGRVYLPVDELALHGLTPDTLAAEARSGHAPSTAVSAMLHVQAARAEQLYVSGAKLLPLIAPDSRPALWVLITIYHRLLRRIECANFDVFSNRVSVPTWEKLLLLARGLARAIAARARRSPSARIHATVSQTNGHKKIAIVGAGVSGLAAGCALADAGYNVTLFERRPYVGGRASSYEHPGSGETIDNCQHILLGCCTNLRSLLDRVGRNDAIAWTSTITYIEPGGRRSVVRQTALPAPLGSAPSFLNARCFSIADKRAIAHGLRQFFAGYPADVPGSETFLAWAHRHRQTPGALKRFWEPILQSALNDDLDRISVHYAGKVIRDSFLNSAEAGRIGVPLLPLSEMYGGAAAYLQARGGVLHLRTGVDGLEQTVEGWRVHTSGIGGEQWQAFDEVILALPLEATQRLVPMLPAGADRDALTQTLEGFEHVPLAGVHLWFDREITELPHAVLLDTTIQWMYQREKLQPGKAKEGSGSHIELVVSVARKLVPMAQREIIDLALRELALFFPAVREARLNKAIVTKEVRATFSVPPGLDTHRPGARTPWPGLYLAGDWTDTGWPATMEGAARSGFLAAEAVTGGQGHFLVADLPPRGLMRLFG
jgi:squalene-associated FAD-dependent desaturase